MEKSLPSIDELKIQDLILSPEQLAKEQIPTDSLFEVKIEGLIQGSIEKKSLQKFLDQAHEDNIEVKTLNSDEWISANLHPLFQRRKPEVLSDISVESITKDLYLLRNGERSGPYSKDSLIEQYKNKELFVTDMLSPNGRTGWQKLYEFQEFNRRTHGQLPHLPQNDILNATPKKLLEDDPELAEIEAIVGLAYVSNIKSGMQEVQYKEKQSKKTKVNIPIMTSPHSTRNFRKPLLIILGITAALFSYAFITNIPTKHGPQVTSSRAKTYKPTKKHATVHKLKPQRRTASARPRVKPVRAKVKKRSNIPFKESAVYKKYKEQRNDAVEPTEVEPEEFEPEYPLDEVNLEEDLDDVSEEEVQEFVKSIHGGFSVRSKEEFDDEGPESEKELFEEELSY